MSPSPNPCGVRVWRRVTFQTAQYPVVTCWSVTEAFVFGFLYVVLACLVDLELPYKPFFCSGVLGKLWSSRKFKVAFSSNPKLLTTAWWGNCSDGADRKFEVSEQLAWFHRSVLKGTEKRATKNVQLVLQHCCKTSWIPMSRVLPPT